MYQQYWRQTPAALEQTLLAELQRQNQQFLNFIRSLSTSQFIPPEALVHILYSIDQYEQSLYGFVPQANQLSSQGFPQLAQQLNFTFRDLSGARMTYAQMYQNEVVHRGQIGRIWMDANTAVTNNILAATNNQIRATNESVQDFLDFMEDRSVIRVRVR